MRPARLSVRCLKREALQGRKVKGLPIHTGREMPSARCGARDGLDVAIPLQGREGKGIPIHTTRAQDAGCEMRCRLWSARCPDPAPSARRLGLSRILPTRARDCTCPQGRRPVHETLGVRFLTLTRPWTSGSRCRGRKPHSRPPGPRCPPPRRSGTASWPGGASRGGRCCGRFRTPCGLGIPTCGRCSTWRRRSERS